MPNMPGRSSTAKDEPDQTGTPSSLLGVTGGMVGSASQGNLVTDPMMWSPANTCTTASIAEGASWHEKYHLLVHIFTARDRWVLEPHMWAEDLLKDFFQLTLEINLSVTLLSPTECLISCGNHTEGQGMSWDESLHYAHQLMGIHPWMGYTIDVVVLQHTLKEAHHDMQVAREFTHERNKQCIAHLKVIASLTVWKSHLATLDMFLRGCCMTWWADRLFVQQQLRDLQVAEPAFLHCPALLDDRPKTLDLEQYDSTQDCEGDNDDEGDALSQLNADLDASKGEEMDTSGHLHWLLMAEGHHQRNHALCRECNQAQQEFCKPQNHRISFPLFRETTKENAISYRDWCSEMEEALERRHDPTKVKQVIFASLEGMAKDNAKMINENGDLHITCILDGLD